MEKRIDTKMTPQYVPKVAQNLDIILEKMKKKIKNIEDTEKGER